MPAEIFIAIAIILLRFFLPFTILRWPLVGGVLAMLADASDVMILSYFGTTFQEIFAIDMPYHFFDKIFDTWYLFLEFLVVRRWHDSLARNTASVLFGIRFLGFLLFLILGTTAVFTLTPNIFEFFFLAMLVIWKFDSNFRLNAKRLVIVLLVVGIPNLVKEYLMHYKYPGQTWDFFKEKLFWWLYN